MKEKPIPPRLKLENGEQVSWLGEKRTLVVVREDRKRGRAKCVMDRLLLFVPYEADYSCKRELLEKWFRKEAALTLKEKAQEFAGLLSVEFKDIHIKDQRSRWGSCSSKGNLNFNWRIVMAPEPVCDYVVIHELCHLKHMDHSSNFWHLVQTICPEYKQYRKWLKENGAMLYVF